MLGHMAYKKWFTPLLFAQSEIRRLEMKWNIVYVQSNPRLSHFNNETDWWQCYKYEESANKIKLNVFLFKKKTICVH